jgi:hypothetical protein
MEKKEGREKIEGAVETENESLLRIKHTNYVCTPILQKVQGRKQTNAELCPKALSLTNHP